MIIKAYSQESITFNRDRGTVAYLDVTNQTVSLCDISFGMI